MLIINYRSSSPDILPHKVSPKKKMPNILYLVFTTVEHIVCVVHCSGYSCLFSVLTTI